MKPRLCSEAEALEILRHPSVLKHLEIYPEGLKDVQSYIIGEKCLVIVIPKKEEAEVHIACPFRDRHGLFSELVEFINFIKNLGYKKITTTAPDERKALTKMLENLGFERTQDYWSITWA